MNRLLPRVFPSFIRLLWPRSLRARLMVLVIPLIALTMIGAGYFLTLSGKDALLKEKETYLLGVTRLLLTHLEQNGGYESLGALPAGQAPERMMQIDQLNRQLEDYTDVVAKAFPGVGVGYYHRHLDAILTYGPKAENGNKVGVSIGATHPGRQVMASGQATVQIGNLVRGRIMNAMTPIRSQDGSVVGYIWANELMDSIDQQIEEMRWGIFWLTCVALFFSLWLVYWVISRFIRDIESIKYGLAQMGGDLSARIPEMEGETGDMANAVNRMAQSLADAQQRERQAATQALAQSEEMLRTAIEATDEAFVLFDDQNCLVFCNERYKAVYPGLRDLLVPGLAYETLLREAVEREAVTAGMSAEEIEDRISKRLALYCAGNASLEEKTLDGRWLRVVNRRTSTGYTVGFRVDITDLKESRDAAEAANRVKGEFLATISHELRTPMNGILGMVELLLTTPLDTEQTDYAETALSSARLLLGLLNDVLDFSKMEAGKFELRQAKFEVRSLLSNLYHLLTGLVRGKSVQLQLDIAEDVPRFLVGDPERLRQILLNLLGNAIKFTEQGSVALSVVLDRLDAHTAELRWEIRDTGIGIAAEKLPILFEPFTQADGSTTRRFGGTGLGLSIVKHLVELMGGRIGVESIIGEGSMFWVSLPFNQAEDVSDDQNA